MASHDFPTMREGRERETEEQKEEKVRKSVEIIQGRERERVKKKERKSAEIRNIGRDRKTKAPHSADHSSALGTSRTRGNYVPGCPGGPGTLSFEWTSIVALLRNHLQWKPWPFQQNLGMLS